ncbi:MAG: leucine-rich repeat domain-containing protein [Candidatus Heimdallarchaeota archaeon]
MACLREIETRYKGHIHPDDIEYEGDRITVLKLDEIGLQEFPEGIGDLTELRELSAYGNEIQNLPGSFKFLQNLEELNLGHNRITRFPEIVCELRNLRRLFLSHNSIAEIPSTIAKMKELEIFFIEENPLRVIPDEIRYLWNLMRFNHEDIEWKHYRKFEVSWDAFSHLIYLENWWREEPFDITEIPLKNGTLFLDVSEEDEYFREISLEGLADPIMAEELRGLDLYWTEVMRLQHTEALLKCRNLRDFNLFYTRLAKFESKHLRNCINLENFEIGASMISKFDTSVIYHWPNLQEFNLIGTLVATLDLEPFKRHPTIKRINISYNEVERLDISPLFECPKLKVIRIDFAPTAWVLEHPLGDKWKADGWPVVPLVKKLIFPTKLPEQCNPDLEVRCKDSTVSDLDANLLEQIPQGNHRVVIRPRVE